MKKMTVAQAAKVFREKKPELKKLKAEVDQAEDVLKEYFRKNEKRTYRNLVSYSSYFQSRFDFPRLKAFLGEREAEFKKDIPIEIVSIIPKGSSTRSTKSTKTKGGYASGDTPVAELAPPASGRGAGA